MNGGGGGSIQSEAAKSDGDTSEGATSDCAKSEGDNQPTVGGAKSEGKNEGAPAAAQAQAERKLSRKTSQPDMLSLSISISILVKFMLFDLVGFIQVNTALILSMPDVAFPPAIKEMSSALTGVFNLVSPNPNPNPNHNPNLNPNPNPNPDPNQGFVTEWGEANCNLGGDQCFRVLVVMLTLVAFQLAFPAAVGLARYLPPLRKRVSQARLDTLIDRAFHGNAVVMMVLHPASPDPNPNPTPRPNPHP